MCWEHQTEVGTYWPCFWVCSLVSPFGLKSWLGSEIRRTPELGSLGDGSEMLNTPEGFFTVVGVVTACRIIIRQWRTTKCPELNEWIKWMLPVKPCSTTWTETRTGAALDSLSRIRSSVWNVRMKLLGFTGKLVFPVNPRKNCKLCNMHVMYSWGSFHQAFLFLFVLYM